MAKDYLAFITDLKAVMRKYNVRVQDLIVEDLSNVKFPDDDPDWWWDTHDYMWWNAYGDIKPFDSIDLSGNYHWFSMYE